MCGHDGHTVCLLSVIPAFLAQINKIPSNKKVRCLFQPAEEPTTGAEVMIKEGCLEGVDEVYGYHNFNLFSFGQIGILPGPITAYVASIEITIRGTGGHASEPENTRYALSRTIKLYQNIQKFI